MSTEPAPPIPPVAEPPCRTSVLVDRDGDFLVVTFSENGGNTATLRFDRKNARDVINAMETVLRGMVDAPYVVNDPPPDRQSDDPAQSAAPDAGRDADAPGPYPSSALPSDGA